VKKQLSMERATSDLSNAANELKQQLTSFTDPLAREEAFPARWIASTGGQDGTTKQPSDENRQFQDKSNVGGAAFSLCCKPTKAPCSRTQVASQN